MSDPDSPRESPPETPAERGEREDREAILQRRARFVAAALVGLGGAALASCEPPRPCLDIDVPPTAPLSSTRASSAASASASAAPSATAPLACLSIVAPREPADAGPPPMPCLSPPPMPCLSKARPGKP